MKRTLAAIASAIAICAAAAFTGCATRQHAVGLDALLPTEGAVNVRDIGGYVGYGGRTVRRGALIRSGDLDSLTARDLALFSEMGIQTVVDFRSDLLIVGFRGSAGPDLIATSERREAPTIWWEGAVPWHERTAIPGDVVSDYFDVINAAHLTPQDVVDMITVNYRDLITQERDADGRPLRQREQYMAFFRAVLASEGAPLLFHCSAGKDRAGVATALLHMALGVSDADIIANYMISRPIVEERFEVQIPRIIDSTARGMRERRQLAQAIAAGAPNSEAALLEFATQTILERTMQGALDAMPSIMPQDQAIEQARQQARAFAASPQGQAAIGLAAGSARAQLGGSILHMTDEQIDAFAFAGSERVRPVLTVFPQWIESAMDEVRTAWGGIENFLDGVSPDMTGAQVVARLRELYLE